VRKCNGVHPLTFSSFTSWFTGHSKCVLRMHFKNSWRPKTSAAAHHISNFEDENELCFEKLETLNFILKIVFFWGCGAVASISLIKKSYIVFCFSVNFFSFLWSKSRKRARATSFLTSLDHTQWHTAACRTLDERSTRRRDIYLRTHNINKRPTSMPRRNPKRPAIPTSDLPQTLSDRSDYR
jgi:hypothetical protein